MFSYIKGIVDELDDLMAVIDCGGVGFACHTTTLSLAKLKLGEIAKLHTYCYIKEDCFDIYAFSSKEELSCFKLLLSVSGVGPKAALSILSANTPESLAVAIITGNEKSLTVAQGIGKKIAQRIILELKDKIAKEQSSISVPSAGMADIHFGGVINEAAAALSVLGYSQQEISSALKDMEGKSMSVEEIIKQSLKKMLK